MTLDRLEHARRFVETAKGRDGLAALDVERFWADDDEAHRDPWSASCPQVPLGIRMSDECVFAELGVPEDPYRLQHDEAYRADLARRYNDRAEGVVGRRLLAERPADPPRAWPPVKALYELFEGRNVWHGESYWLTQAARGEDELRALLDRVEKRLEDPRGFFLPEGWDAARDLLLPAGILPPPYRQQRGPVTLAMSLYGVEDLVYLLVDEPGLAARFRDLILRGLLARARLIDEESGLSAAAAPRGFAFFDDNCAMLTADMYEFFGYPVLRGAFAAYAPSPGDARYQHSDSDMGHLLPVLARLDLNAVNFGPNLTVNAIRAHLPRAVIHGQLAPFTFSRNEEVNMVAELLRDVDMAREHRGLVFTTAGSINNGSRLGGMRLLMAAIQALGRYA